MLRLRASRPFALLPLMLGFVSAARATIPDPRFVETPYVSGLSNPDGFVAATDGTDRFFVVEKATGRIRVIKDGVLLPTPLATVTPLVSISECGLLGIALDPDFMNNHWIYVFATVSSTEQQILRYTEQNDLGVDRQVIITGLPTRAANHNGGAVGVGPDGHLYWAVGDNGNGTGINADLLSLAAKVGRARTDGTLPDDNPFDDGAGPNNDFIWARGFRNPYTFTFEPSRGRLWVAVVGTSYEQIFVLQAGDHGGWNAYENTQPAGFVTPAIKYRTGASDSRTIFPGGAVRAGGIATITTGSSHFFRQGEPITIDVLDPSFDGTFFVRSTPSANTFTVVQAGPDAVSGGGTALTQNIGRVVIGPAFYDGTDFPPELRGNLFFGDFISGAVLHATLRQDGSVDKVERFGTIPQFIDFEVGRDGALYALTYGGAIRRIAFIHGAPALIVSALNVRVAEGGSTTFGVRLATAPAAPVTVTIARTGGDPDISVPVGSLIFDAGNFSIPQPISVEAATDLDAAIDLATLTVSAPGHADVAVTVRTIEPPVQPDAPPVASITRPVEGEVVFGSNAGWFGTGTDDRGTVRAEFYVDGVLDWIDTNASGVYHYGDAPLSWDTRQLTEGLHTLRMVVFDTAGQSGFDEVVVLVDNVAGRRKGLGGRSGEGDYCDNPAALCVFGEGDCDFDRQCATIGDTPGICIADNGGRYGGRQQLDYCAPASCNNRVQDGATADVSAETGIDCGNPECGSCSPDCDLPLGHADRCAYHCPCPLGGGDCDSREQCAGGLQGSAICKPDIGARFGWPAGHDVCVPAHCGDRVSSGDEDPGRIDCGGSCGPCTCPTGIPGGECTPSCPCGAGQGDCDVNLDCAPGLFCREEGLVDACRPL